MFNRILRRPLSQIKEYSIQKSNKLRKMSIFGSREDTLSFTSVCDGVDENDGNSPRKKVVNSPSKNASVNTNSSKLKPDKSAISSISGKSGAFTNLGDNNGVGDPKKKKKMKMHHSIGNSNNNDNLSESNFLVNLKKSQLPSERLPLSYIDEEDGEDVHQIENENTETLNNISFVWV